MKPFSLAAQPVIIIGAGRSGTNILRDVMTQLGGVDTWPCDEINYIWRHGNRSEITDEFTGAQATDKVSRFIRTAFLRFTQQSSLMQFPESQRYVLEKTCANSLRVGFVDAVLPEAKYVFLVRDGRNVVASARKRWKAPLDIPYLMAKARYVPKSDLAYYGSRYLVNRLSRQFNKERALSVWGPRFHGMAELGENHDLDHVCAHQWVRCVEQAELAFKQMSPSKYHRVYYEDLTEQPLKVLEGIANFLGFNHTPEELEKACSQVRISGKARRKEFDANDENTFQIMEPLLKTHHYLAENPLATVAI